MRLRTKINFYMKNSVFVMVIDTYLIIYFLKKIFISTIKKIFLYFYYVSLRMSPFSFLILLMNALWRVMRALLSLLVFPPKESPFRFVFSILFISSWFSISLIYAYHYSFLFLTSLVLSVLFP